MSETLAEQKHCTGCSQDKPLTDFAKNKSSKDGLQDRCKPCNAERMRQYRIKYPDRVLATRRKTYANPKVKANLIAYQKRYRTEFREKCTERRRKYLSKPGKRDRMKARVKIWKAKPHIKVGLEMRAKLCRLINRRSATPEFMTLLGLKSFDEFKNYIESLFKPGMTWENHDYYGWHIDHKIPISHFNMLDEAEVAKAMHYTNLQPLWWYENIRKANLIQS